MTARFTFDDLVAVRCYLRGRQALVLREIERSAGGDNRRALAALAREGDDLLVLLAQLTPASLDDDASLETGLETAAEREHDESADDLAHALDLARVVLADYLTECAGVRDALGGDASPDVRAEPGDLATVIAALEPDVDPGPLQLAAVRWAVRRVLDRYRADAFSATAGATVSDGARHRHARAALALDSLARLANQPDRDRRTASV